MTTTRTQQTVKELTPALGSTVGVRFESLIIDCTVVDAKNSWGKVRLLVRPAAGVGEQWIELNRLCPVAGNVATPEANQDAHYWTRERARRAEYLHEQDLRLRAEGLNSNEGELLAMYAINTENKQIARRQKMERMIVRRVVKDALQAGYRLSVDDGGDELAITSSTSQKAVLAALVNTDDDKLIFEREDHRGVVWFVYGNDGYDVVADYSTRLEDVLAGANALAEKLEARS